MVSESEVVAAAFLSFLLLFSFFLGTCGFVENSVAISEIVLDDVQAWTMYRLCRCATTHDLATNCALKLSKFNRRLSSQVGAGDLNAYSDDVLRGLL